MITPRRRIMLLRSSDILNGPMLKCERVRGIHINHDNMNVRRKKCKGVTDGDD